MEFVLSPILPYPFIYLLPSSIISSFSFRMSSSSIDKKKKEVKKAVKMKDPIVNLQCLPQSLSTLDGEKLNYRTSWSTNLSQEIHEWIFDLFERNMRLMYEKSQWGWDPVDKKNELGATTARFVILSNEEGKDIAYVHYRIDMDHGYAVLYCYEIQVESEYQRKGLGSLIMNILDKLATKLCLEKIMATVFKYNIKSLNFFRKIGFEEDETNPSDRDYLILSRPV